MTTLYAHPYANTYYGGLCAPRDFRTRAELTAKEGLYATPRAKTRKGVLVCAYCGQELLTTTGLFHVVAWRGDNGYTDADVLFSYSRRSVAEAKAYALGPDYVVRAW